MTTRVTSIRLVSRCMQKSPDRRYSDMEELISDLKESLVNPEGDFVKIAPLDSRAHTVIVSQDELNKIKEGRNEMQQAEEPYPANQSETGEIHDDRQHCRRRSDPGNLSGTGRKCDRIV